MQRLVALLATLAVVGAACGESSPTLAEDTLVLVVSTDLAVGTHRVAVGAVDLENQSVADPALDVKFEFFRPDGTPAGEAETRFVWAIPDVRGMWVADFEFDVAGNWTVGLRDASGSFITSPPFAVPPDTVAVDVGEPAPPSTSKTSRDASLAEITTDPDPDPSFYELTVADAVTSGKPSVIVFATPAFCTSATCGPSLDVAKQLSGEFGDVVFVHVEVFDNLDAVTREELVLVPPVNEWRLPTEPWVFVVDRNGIVQARFEGAIGEDELRTAIAAVS